MEVFIERDVNNTVIVINTIINQYALFSLISTSNYIISGWLDEHNESGFKIIIRAELKLEIRDKLEQTNINERIIYPGLDGWCK